MSPTSGEPVVIGATEAIGVGNDFRSGIVASRRFIDAVADGQAVRTLSEVWFRSAARVKSADSLSELLGELGDGSSESPIYQFTHLSPPRVGIVAEDQGDAVGGR